MNRRRCGLVAIVSLASALGLAAPATAEPTLSASTQMVRAGQVINVAGNRWETFWAVVCPGALSFVSVSFVQRDEADHLATLSPWEVWPITGAWNYDVRIPAGARPGPAQIVAQQNKTSFDLFRGGCYREGTLSRTVEVNVAGTPIADPPSPPAEIRLYSVTPIAGNNRARPGATLEVTGTGFEVPERCRYASSEVRFSLTDASGTGTLLGERFRVDEHGRLTDYHGRRRISLPLPDEGLTPGPAAITASREGRGIGCTRTAGLEFRIVMNAPAVRVSPGSHVSGQLTRITGTNWRTDRCDRMVGLYLVEDGERFRLVAAMPKGLGAFSVQAKMPDAADSGTARIVAEQFSGLEVRDKATPPGKTRCYYRKLAKRVASARLTIAAPPPPPLAPPPPSPPPPPRPAAEPQCSDRGDNDSDGRVDLDDPGCESASDDSESPDPALPQCSDGKDNDDDGKIDGKDPGCDGSKDESESPDPKPQSTPQCSDGKDNDGDGAVDFPDDKQCSAKDDDSEGK